MTGTANDPKPAKPQVPAAASGKMFMHFQFLHLDSKFHILQSNEKLVARQEFLSAMEPLQRNTPLFCTYALIGLRSDCDILLWRGAQSLDVLQDTYERLGSYGVGKYLAPVSGYLTAPTSLPQPPKAKYLFIRPVIRTREWLALSAAQRQELSNEESQIISGYSSLKPLAFDAFDVQGPESIQTYQTEIPSDFFSLLQDIRNSKSAAFASPEAPVFTCIRKDIRDIVDTLG